MPEITLVKRGEISLTDTERSLVHRVLFDMIDGLGALNQKRWRRFWNRFLRSEPGEMATITTASQRMGSYHRRHMLIESKVFAGQERIASFETFRYWLKLGAGFVDWMPGPKGGVVPVPRSISYAACEEGVFREFHDAAIAFLRTEHAIAYLWPKLPREQRFDAIDNILLPFEE